MEKNVTYIFLAVGVTMFIFATLQITARRKRAVNYSLSVLFFCLGYIWFYYGIYRVNRLTAAPGLLYSDVAATFLAGPALFEYTRNLAGRPRASSARRILPFLPAMVVLSYLLLFRPSAAVPVSRLSGPNPDHFWVPTVRVLNTLGDLHFFFHVAASTRLVAGIYRAGDLRFRSRFRGVLIYFTNALITFILFFIGHSLGSDNLLGIAVLANGINSVYFFFLSYRYPEYTQRSVRVAGSAERPPFSKSLDAPAILAGLERAVEAEEGYRDPDITLQALSTRLGIQHHQLSLILNEYMRTNFRGYINRRRVDAAKKLLTDEPGTSILDIAFAVGFNSKSAFNSAFIKEAGLSPSDFRKKSLKTS